MFDSLYAQEKLATLEFADQQKFRSIPSLALPAICALDEYITKDMSIFEWGSGASTLFFAQRCGELVSMEHNEDWFKTVGIALRYRLSEFSALRRLVKPADGFDPDFGSYQPSYQSVNFKDYVQAIDDDPAGWYDVILVDGRARNACLEAAKPKLKPGGLLILDDSLRSIYQRSVAAIEWPVKHFEGCIPFYKHGHTVRTTFWVKE